MKLIKNALIFIFLTFLIYIFTLFILVKFEFGNGKLIYSVVDATSIKGGDTYRRFHEYEINKKYDLVVLGSSHAYRGYDIRNFEAIGLSAYNLGSSSQNIQQTYELAKDLCTSKNTKKVIIEIYQNSFIKNNSGLEDAASLIANVASNNLALSIATSNNDIRSYNHFFIRLLTNNEAPLNLPIDSIYYKGYCMSTDTIFNIDSITNAIRKNPESWKKSEVDFDKIEQLSKLIQFLKSELIEVVICSHFTPIETDKFIESLVNPEIEKICELNKVKYLNFMFKHQLSTQHHFYDHHHMNANGVKIYNASLIKELKSIGFI